MNLFEVKTRFGRAVPIGAFGASCREALSPHVMIYLDNNATTPLHPDVATAMDEVQRSGYVNPASQHSGGRRARRILEEARQGIGEILGAKTDGMDADQILFTSGGTEANNLAILGLLGRNMSPPKGLVISAIEHPSVTMVAELALRMGHNLATLPVDENGVARITELPALLTPTTRVVSLMLGNNETGVLQPVADVVEVCRRFEDSCSTKSRSERIQVHCDATQCIAKIPVDFRRLNVDALAASAHKFHGPVGVGVLILRHAVKLDPLLFGGFQQGGLRPGTESVALAVGMHRALSIWQQEQDAWTERLTANRNLLESELSRRCTDVVINGAGAPRVPHTTNIAFRGLDRQALVMALDMAGIACSTGSACASGSSEPSPVLIAMGLEKEVVEGSIRLSLSGFTTAEEIVEAARRISKIVNDLRLKRKSILIAPGPPKTPAAPV